MTPWSHFESHLFPGPAKTRVWGRFGNPLGIPFGALLRPILGSRSVLEAFGGHVGGTFGPFGRLSVSTSFLDPKNYQKLSFFGVADVVKT